MGDDVPIKMGEALPSRELLALADALRTAASEGRVTRRIKPRHGITDLVDALASRPFPRAFLGTCVSTGNVVIGLAVQG
ncbi:hypothetical protein KM043_004262 [Ampulex compressa]|nr:hypothetical protein KM043_004262 [Ampulex compressa]